MISPLFVLAWKRCIGSFKSPSGGLVVPLEARGPLLDYITKGDVPEGYLRGVLTRDFDATFYGLESGMDKARVAIVWEFVRLHFPARAWGSQRAVYHYSMMVKNGVIGRRQADMFKKLEEAGSDAPHVNVD